MTTCSEARKSKQRNRTNGKVLEGLSGSKNVACMERKTGNLGGTLKLLLGNEKVGLTIE